MSLSDPLGYAPLLTGFGISHAYDPTAVAAPPPPPSWSSSVGFKRTHDLDYIDYGPDAYNPLAPTPRPKSPKYSAHSPPPEDLLDSEEEPSEESSDEANEIEDGEFVEIKDLKIFARSPEEILKLSAVHVTTDKISAHGTPLVGGLRDPRFGCAGGRPCGTCGARGAKRCNGHFGSYSLSTPLFNVAFNKVVMLWLRVICNECGHVHASASSVAKSAFLKNVVKSAPSECEMCASKMRQSLVWKASAQCIFETATEDEISAEDALLVFRRVPDDHPIFRVVTHPRRMITTVVFVPSIVIRPAVGGAEEGESARGESDLSYRLVKIVRADLLLKKKLKEGLCDYVSKQSALLGLQNAYTGYIDSRQCYRKRSRAGNSANGTDLSHQSKYKCLRDLLTGKTGYFRNNLSGKRVDHASRGVIGPFVGAHPTWVGIPAWMAKEMTKPLKVTSWNIVEVQKMVHENKVLFLTKKNGERVDLKLHPNPGPLEVGCTVSRQLKDGDLVLMNRQPTLSKRSILAHRVKILKDDRIFRIPLSVTSGYNADFDGDEMNMHVPQNIMAQAEAEELLCAEHSVINSANGNASVCNVQGDRLGAYKMSDPSATITRHLWFACLDQLSEIMQNRAVRRPPLVFPCRASELWSLALPDEYNWEFGGVCILNARLVRGRVTKKVLGVLVHDIWADRGATEALDHVHHVHLAAGAYNSLVHPTTIRFSEVSSSETIEKKCMDIIKDEYDDFERVRESKHSSRESVQRKASKCMSNSTRRITEYVFNESMSKHKGFRDLVESGAKGSRVNFAMVLGSLGKMLHSKDTKGLLPPIENTNGNRRSFTHTSGRDVFTDAYVKSGYSLGMSISEYCIHSKAGRRGLISSSNMVGKVGYMFRRLCTTMDSLTTWGGSVRDTSTNAIVSWKYGDDGRSPFYVEKELLNVPETPAGVPPALLGSLAAALAGFAGELKDLIGDTAKKAEVPVSIRRILHDARCRQLKPPVNVCEEACSVNSKLEVLCSDHGLYFGPLVKLWLRVHLHPFAVWGLSRTAILDVVEKVDRILWKCRVEDGEPVGLLCASSLSAAATQTTLDSFHHIGESDGNYNDLEECINANQHRRNPRVTFKMNLTDEDTQEWVKKHQRITLRDVVLDKSLPKSSDSQIMKDYWEYPDTEGEVPFEARMRLEVKSGSPFQVKVALESLGCERIAYAMAPTGHYIFHTNFDVSMSRFENVVVSGRIRGLKVVGGNTVCCAHMSYKELEEFWQVVNLSSWCTNDFHNTKDLLGIEAARALVVKSLTQMLKTFGVTMASRHVNLLCDKMTHSGELLGCTRHGLKRANPEGSFVQRATFEQPINVMVHAAALSGVDKLQGPLARQVFGQTIYTGTNHPWMHILCDKKFARENAIVHSPPEEEEGDDLDFIGADTWMPQQTPMPPPGPPPPLNPPPPLGPPPPLPPPGPPPGMPDLRQDPWSSWNTPQYSW